ncbi:MAG TPA: hypothetical protein PKE30_20060, partial [Niabella sp.]|nr:hypothetical protein [Niabella sp.]
MKILSEGKGVLFLTLLFCFSDIHGQFLKKLGDRAVKSAERTVERRVERESAQKTDEAIDGVLKGKKDKSPNGGKSSERSNTQVEVTSTTINAQSDFEPGNKVLVLEDFARDVKGDFPAGWNTDASGKVVTLSGSEIKWLELSTPGTFVLETIKQLPVNFTLEFDLFVPSSFSYYDYPLWLIMADMKSKKDFFIWGKNKEKRGKDKRNGVLLMLHPQEEGGIKKGYSEYEIWENGEKAAFNRIKSLSSFSTVNNQVKVQIWRQQQRLRVYLGGNKIW